MAKFNLQVVDPSWRKIIMAALSTMDKHYLKDLQNTTKWLPGAYKIFNAFSLPLPKTRYILFGESPYPRVASANGFAFWDAAVDSLWSPTGMTKTVNRATSLRNFMKMLMIANGALKYTDTSQAAIAQINKTFWVQNLAELFHNFLSKGFLLLNASLVLSERSVRHDSYYWHPFITSIFEQLTLQNNYIELILFGKVAEKVMNIKAVKRFPTLIAEHPYNTSFIKNQQVINFFHPFKLLQRQSSS